MNYLNDIIENMYPNNEIQSEIHQAINVLYSSLVANVITYIFLYLALTGLSLFNIIGLAGFGYALYFQYRNIYFHARKLTDKDDRSRYIINSEFNTIFRALASKLIGQVYNRSHKD